MLKVLSTIEEYKANADVFEDAFRQQLQCFQPTCDLKITVEAGSLILTVVATDTALDPAPVKEAMATLILSLPEISTALNMTVEEVLSAPSVKNVRVNVIRPAPSPYPPSQPSSQPSSPTPSTEGSTHTIETQHPEIPSGSTGANTALIVGVIGASLFGGFLLIATMFVARRRCRPAELILPSEARTHANERPDVQTAAMSADVVADMPGDLVRGSASPFSAQQKWLNEQEGAPGD